MADKNKLGDKLTEIGKALGGIVAVIIAGMDARVRPFIGEGVTLAQSFGIRSARLVRQLVDRHLVAMVLRPLLIMSTVIITVLYGLGARWINSFGVEYGSLGEAGMWLGGIAFVATILSLILIGLVWRVRGLRDPRIRALRRTVERAELAPVHQAAGALAQNFDTQLGAIRNALAVPGITPVHHATLAMSLNTLSALQAELDTVQRELGEGNFDVSARLETMITTMHGDVRGVGQHRIDPAVLADPGATAVALTLENDLRAALTAATVMRAQVETARTRVVPAVQARILTGFGRPGYAPHIVVTLIAQWAVAGLCFIGLAMVLQSWHRGAMIAEHVDPRWTTGLVILGGVLLFGAAGWLTLAIAVARGAITYGLRFVLWPARFVLFTAVEIFDFDDENDELRVEQDFGLPIDEWNEALGEALAKPMGVLAGMLMLLATAHTTESAMYIAGDAFVLLCGYFFLVRMAGIKNEFIYRGVVIGHFLVAVALLILWAFQPTTSQVYGTGVLAFIFANIVTPTFVAIVAAVAVFLGWLSTKTTENTCRMLRIATTIVGTIAIAMMLARSALPETPTTGATEHASVGEALATAMAQSLAVTHTVNAGTVDNSAGHSCVMSADGTTCR